MRRTIIVLGLVLATFLGALAAFAHVTPGHDGHAGTNVPANPGAGRHRVSEHGTNDAQCTTDTHIKMFLKITVDGGAVDLNAAEMENQASGVSWWSHYTETFSEPFGVYTDGTWTVMTREFPAGHNNSTAWHVAFEVAGANPDPNLTSVFITRSCVAD